MSITPPEPLAALEPILDPADTPRDIHGKPIRSWSSGVVAETFFDRGLKWFNNLVFLGVLPADVLPEPPEVSGGRRGQRIWTLYDVERFAFYMFHNELRREYDAAALYRTLDVVYAVARNQGLIPRDVDPIAQLRPAPRVWTPTQRSKSKTKAKGDSHRPRRSTKPKSASTTLEQPTLEEAIAEEQQD